ncbi:MAG: TauD/TfdA family dioxygenase [Burkholderiaceae bacterium]|nr:TauD/TfdA family dioxygenase [Burkholderiaceae bacterium]
MITRTASKALHAAPLSEHIGADLAGVIVQDILEDDWLDYRVKQELGEHLVLRLRSQEASAGTMVELAKRFGPLMDVRQVGNGALHVPGHDEIKVISNIFDGSGRRLGDGNASAQIWHVDASYWEAPPGVTIFYARQTPAHPPKTWFLNMIKVYESLPEDIRNTIAQLRVIHHQYPRGVELGVHEDGPSLPLETRSAGILHPLVRRHLPTGRPILFLPYRRDCVIPGWSQEDATALLTQLWDIAESSPYQTAVALEPGDVVIWDNRGIVHRRDSWSANEGRLMWHLSSQGEVPTPMFPPKVVNINALGIDGTGDKSYIAGVEL